MTAPKLYGTPPINLGILDLAPKEMMFWLYCPIKLPGELGVTMPPNLGQYYPLVEACMLDAGEERWFSQYVYLTAKTLWVTPTSTGQRSGWHCDGFMTDDLNYIWSDREPTYFATVYPLINFTQEHKQALKEMDEIGEKQPITTYPLKSLLRLDQYVLHRVGDFTGEGMRAFVKLSVSRHPYNLVGNSINHALPPLGAYVNRSGERNPEIARLNDHVEAM